MSRQLRLDVAQLTDVGRKRPHNEDNMAYVIPKDEQVMAKKGALFIVADGMGGHAAGEVASEIAVETVTVTYYQDESEDLLLSLMNAIKRANTIIHQRAAENMLRSGMGTTCVAAILRGNMAYVANVGDSRAYIVRHGQIRQISQDHSWVEEQVRAGLLTRDQARSHAQRNVITRCLGTQAEVEVDVFSESLEEGDTLLLCSDGLSGYIAEDDLRSIVAQYIPQESVYHLVERANENSGADNITAIVVRVQEVGTAEMTPATRLLVPVGGSSADEDTMVLGRTPSSTLGSSVRSDDGRTAPAVTRPLATSPLFSSSASSTSHLTTAVNAKRKSRRLLYPTLALVIILLVTFTGGVAYYFLYWQRDVNHRLDAIANILNDAGSMNDPAAALQALSKAQSELRDVSGNGTVLVGSQSTRVVELQNDLTAKVQKNIASYNRQNKILSLTSSCNIAQTSAITTPTATTKPALLTEMQDAKQNTFSYILANESDNTTMLYLLGAQKNLTKVDTKAFGNTQPVLVTGQSTWLFLVTKLVGPNDTTSYKLYALQQNTDGTLTAPADHAARNLSTDAALSNNKQPQLITSSGDDIYVFSYAANSPQLVTVLHYNLANWNNAAEVSQLQVSFPLRSVVAFPNKQLVLLTSDGAIQRSVFAVGTSTPLSISLQSAIPATVGVEPQDFTWDTSFTAPANNPSQPLFLNVLGASLLSVDQIAGKTYLFVLDDLHHRIIQLDYTLPATQTTPAASTPTAVATTQTTGGGAIEQVRPQYVRQLVSASVQPAMKSIAVDPKDGHLNLLTLSTRQSAALASIDTAKASTC